MTNLMLERLAFIAAHRLLSMESLDSQAIPGKQFVCAGKRRSIAVERIAAEIMMVFEGADQAELAAAFESDAHERIARR